MILKLAHKHCKAIWKWLSKYSKPELSVNENKEAAIKAVGIVSMDYFCHSYCPYCKYGYGKSSGHKCSFCPIYKKYHEYCYRLCYSKWVLHRTPENAEEFYDKIKYL